MASNKENETPAPVRASKFREATMNSTSSIHAPPDMLWDDLGIEGLIEKYNQEANAPAAAATAAAVVRKRLERVAVGESSAVMTPAPVSSVAPAAEGPLGRFSRAVASFFNGATFSALGKRKAGNEHAEKGLKDRDSHAPGQAGGDDDRKKRAEAAYKEAKELGLLPTPKVFVRPVSRARKASMPSNLLPDTPTPTPSALAPPQTPTLHKSPSKKDLHKQKKLSKRVSDLEHKLAEARKELTLALGSPSVPPVPPLPSTLPPTPNSSTNHFWSENELSPHNHAESASASASKPAGKITKKRKASGADNDDEYKPIPTDSEKSLDSERESKRSKKNVVRKKSSSRLTKKKSTVTTKEEVVIVVPDGVSVPPIPSIPKGVDGKRAAVSRKDDGYGGLGHEIF
ncbi:hypothetical protein BU26DRAFT_517376 [Trematosphaeria pertusa]|uniref:Uncharacterized protein n=1 Tax=Trematosphaeria pertusa TaxID=390896 RepID=A0A6A6IIW7_9PLEO|nr:uncharacterized protein BU26DRAFT_517376 [Trematosphaeria pertusa]KAF2250545.1 hypothetical protein BU26DRAFT_517376 [Trematosphaeria pertusa]